jgi:hypothetical protein
MTKFIDFLTEKICNLLNKRKAKDEREEELPQPPALSLYPMLSVKVNPQAGIGFQGLTGVQGVQGWQGLQGVGVQGVQGWPGNGPMGWQGSYPATEPCPCCGMHSGTGVTDYLSHQWAFGRYVWEDYDTFVTLGGKIYSFRVSRCINGPYRYLTEREPVADLPATPYMRTRTSWHCAECAFEWDTIK